MEERRCKISWQDFFRERTLEDLAIEQFNTINDLVYNGPCPDKGGAIYLKIKSCPPEYGNS